MIVHHPRVSIMLNVSRCIEHMTNREKTQLTSVSERRDVGNDDILQQKQPTDSNDID